MLTMEEERIEFESNWRRQVLRIGRLVEATSKASDSALRIGGEWRNLSNASDLSPDFRSICEKLTESLMEEAVLDIEPPEHDLLADDTQGTTRLQAIALDGEMELTQLFLGWREADSSGVSRQLLDDIAAAVTSILRSHRVHLVAEKQLDQLETVVDLVNQPIAVRTRSGDVVLTNRAFRELQEAVTSSEPEFERRVFGLDGLSAEISAMESRILTLNVDGDERIFELDTQRYDDWDLRGDALLVVMSELTESVRHEKVLQKQKGLAEASNKRLEQSNEELEQFAYIASHDLQEPLRMVSSFLSLLEEEYSEQLDENALEYIEYAVDGARRMKSMVDDLLAFSRIRQTDVPYVRIDLEEFVQSIMSEVDVPQDIDVALSLEDLPEIAGRRVQIERLFMNLLKNAVQYGGRDDLEITVRCVDDGAHWRITVEDDGVGIPKSQRERIFRLFVRGSSDVDRRGSGIGLAVCSTVVAAHGGEIRVEEGSKGGARFVITLLKEPESV